MADAAFREIEKRLELFPWDTSRSEGFYLFCFIVIHAGHSCSSFLVPILTVLGGSSLRQVRRVATWRVIAGMNHEKIRETSAVNEKGKPMGSYSFPIESGQSISIFVSKPLPFPAFSRRFHVHVIPEFGNSSGDVSFIKHKQKAERRASARSALHAHAQKSKSSSHVPSRTAEKNYSIKKEESN